MKNIFSLIFVIYLILLLVVPGCRKSKISETPAPPLKVDSVYSWVCNMQMENGLLKSSENGRLVSLYDNALAALVFTAYGDFSRAEKIFDFFERRMESEFLVTPGGFGQMRTSDGIPVENRPRRWLGDNAWLLIALNNYHHFAQNNRYENLETALSNWIVSLQDKDGGIWGGFDEKGKQISKIAEGNIDAFNAIKGYTDFHRKLLMHFKQVRWDKKDQLLIAWAENPEYKYALDLHSWGYCAFEGFPESVLRKANRFLTTQKSTLTKRMIHGYCFDEDRDVVWLEGTGQMAVAFIKAKKEKEALDILSSMEKNLSESKMFPGAYGLPYTSNFGSSYGNDLLWEGVGTNIAISSTAWYLLARLRFDPLELGYEKNIPDEDKFWTK
jgi:hypothetical protein